MMRQFPMRRLTIYALLLVGLFTSPVGPTQAATAELRAFWVDGFNDGFQTPFQCDQLLARVRAAHMNAVIVEMRTRADAYYASRYEPWAADDPQHFDALAYLCARAHAPGLPYVQVHAWVNACSVGGNASRNSLAALHPDWLSLSDTGADYDGESTKIDPGNPAAADWTYRVCLDIVRHYDIDGLHLDAIRYGGEGRTLGHWGYNAVSVARYHALSGTSGQPAWDDPRWMQWRRDQVTALVRRVSVAAHALKPHLIVSAATICWGEGPGDTASYRATSDAYARVFADWVGWLHDGLLDLNCPMTYFDEANEQQAADWPAWAGFIKNHQFGRLSTLGVGAYLNTIPASLGQIMSAGDPTGQGNAAAGVVLFSYASTNSGNGQIQQYDPAFYQMLGTVFQADVPPPPMPWLDHPTTGTMIGTLLRGKDLTPVDGARVSVSPVSQTPFGFSTISDGNGFFAFPRLPPGDYRVWTSDKGLRLAISVRVKPGRTSARILLSQASPVFRHVAGLGSRPEGASVTVLPALVTVGSDRLGASFYVADGFGKTPLRVCAPALSPPTIKGDIVAVSGTLHHGPGGAFLDAMAVRVVGAALVK